MAHFNDVFGNFAVKKEQTYFKVFLIVYVLQYRNKLFLMNRREQNAQPNTKKNILFSFKNFLKETSKQCFFNIAYKMLHKNCCKST